MKRKGIITQIIGLIIIGVGIGFQLNGGGIKYLIIVSIGLLIVFTGLFMIISIRKKQK